MILITGKYDTKKQYKTSNLQVFLKIAIPYAKIHQKTGTAMHFYSNSIASSPMDKVHHLYFLVNIFVITQTNFF